MIESLEHTKSASEVSIAIERKDSGCRVLTASFISLDNLV